MRATRASQVALACLFLTASAVAETTLRAAPGDERLVYEWKVEGIKGLFLRLVAPGRGEGSLTTVLNEQGHLETELHISAERRRRA